MALDLGILAGLGIGGSVIGSLIGGSAQKSAANAEIAAAAQRLALTDSRLNSGLGRTSLAVLGGPQAEQYLRMLPTDQWEQLFGRPAKAGGFTPDMQREYEDIQKQITAQGASVTRNTRGRANPQLDSLLARKAELEKLAEGDPGKTGEMNPDVFKTAGPGIVGEMGQLADQYRGQTAGMVRASQGIEAGVRGFGDQERKRISVESDRALTSANRAVESKLIGRGLGNSTVLTGAMTANARAIGEQKDNALGSLNDRQINTLTGLRSNQLGLMERRAAGQMSMDQAPINTKLQLFTGGIANPWVNRDTSQFVSSASPGGAMASSVGNMLAAGGGQMGNLAMLGYMKQAGIF